MCLYNTEFFYCIKFQCSIGFYNFRTYYFYEFGKDEQHVALMTGVNNGRVCYYMHFIDITYPPTYARICNSRNLSVVNNFCWLTQYQYSKFSLLPHVNHLHISTNINDRIVRYVVLIFCRLFLLEQLHHSPSGTAMV